MYNVCRSFIRTEQILIKQHSVLTEAVLINTFINFGRRVNSTQEGQNVLPEAK